MKRLFLFAAYEEAGVVGESLLWYLRSLSEVGDVVLVADSDIDSAELEALKVKVVETQTNIENNEYVLVEYDTTDTVSDVTYRKKPCCTVAFGTYNEMQSKLYREYNRYTSQNMRVLATSKVKIVNL